MFTAYVFCSSNTNGQGDIDAPIYVINLDRSPDRLKLVDEQMKQYGLKYTRFQAVDGYALKIVIDGEKHYGKENLKKIFPQGIFVMSSKNIKIVSDLYEEAAFFLKMSPVFFKFRKQIGLPLSFGELGVTYSHRAIWLDIVKNNYDKAIIFEDDVLFADNFRKKLLNVLKNIPKDADIVLLGWNAYHDDDCWSKRPIGVEPVNEVLGSYNVKNIMGAYSYIITRIGAKKLIEKTQNISEPIDLKLEDLRRKKELIIYFPYRKIVTVNSEESIINEMGRKDL